MSDGFVADGNHNTYIKNEYYCLFVHTAIQIMFVKERHHWIATSFTDNKLNWGSMIAATMFPQVWICRLPLQLYQQAVTDAGLVVTVTPFQQQQSELSNCRLFCIAAAVQVAEGRRWRCMFYHLRRNPTEITSHFEPGKLLCFPTGEGPVEWVELSNIVIPVNCECKMPDSQVEMVACDCCDRWYHFTCAGFIVPPLGDWFCKNCIKALYLHPYCIT